MLGAKPKVKVKDPGTICGWCDGTGVDKEKKCPLCLGEGKRFSSEEDEARWNKLYAPKKAEKSSKEKAKKSSKK